MKMKRIASPFAAVILLVMSCRLEAAETEPPSAPAKPAGFEVPRDEIVKGIKRIAVMPVVVPAIVRQSLDDREVIARRLETTVVAMLKGGGFDVIDAEPMRAIRKRATETIGALYDKMTGAPDAEKLKALRDFTENEFESSQRFDARLLVVVLRDRAFAEGAWADWEGSRQFAYGAEKPPFGISLERVPVPLEALSIAVVLQDASRKTLYNRVQGLQLTQVLRFMRGTGYVASPIDESARMTDVEREKLVVEAMLAPLAVGVAPRTEQLVVPREAAMGDLVATKFLTSDELFRKYKRIGLLPPQFAAEGAFQKVAPRYLELIASHLKKHNYEVVLDESLAAAWQAERESAGGFYDPVTGLRDTQRWDAARRRVIASFRTRNNVDAVVIPDFEEVFAPVQQGWANWDGNKQLALVMGKGLGRFINIDTMLAGSLPALSIVLRVTDSQENELLETRGGVHILAKIDKGKVVDVPESELFADLERDKDAVAAATRRFRPKPKQTVPR